MASLSPTPRHQGLLGPGLEAAEIGAALAQLGQDPEISKVVLFGSRARCTARRDSDLDLLLIVAGSLTPERDKQLRRRVRDLLLPLLPVDLDLLISDAATTSRWAGSRWHVFGHIHREGVPLDAT
ncbi:MAG: nucleotidyltransferase domain-containing protein [Cyanobium sp. M30B3]|nr:MAG: nucleotidyltransferase domain-containing protein [Cyanobium sp. M30B3]